MPEKLDASATTSRHQGISRDTLREYAEKLLELGLERAAVVQFIALISALCEAVRIEFFHLPHYPSSQRYANSVIWLVSSSRWSGRPLGWR